MYAFFGAISVIGFIVGIVLMILGWIKKKKYKGWLIALISLVVFIVAVATTPNDEKASADKAPNKPSVKASNDTKLTDQQKATIDSLNDFESFIDNYKNLGNLKTPTWDNYLYGKQVTWTGNVMEVGSSQIYIWGTKGYKGQTWSDVTNSKNHDAYNVFVAKFENGVPQSIKVGDKITVRGILKSRGDYNLNYEWKIYNTELKITKK